MESTGVYNDSMVSRLCALAGFCACLSGQVLSNKSLTGKYFFREVLLASDTPQVQSAFGTLTFDGNGSFSLTSQQLTDGSAPVNGNANNLTYSVDAAGLVTMSDPLRSGTTVNARLGNGALTGSNTEAGNNVFSILVAVAAPSSPVNAGTLAGSYWMASLEFTNGALSARRQTFFPVTSNGSGSLGNPNIVGEAGDQGDRQMTQVAASSTYTINTDGTGSMTFPFPSVLGPNGAILGGTKTIYVAQDGSFFFGGGASTGGQGILIGIKAATNATASILNALYWSAGMRVEGPNYSGYAASNNALGNGNMTASRRLRSNSGILDVTALTPYSVTPDGSGIVLDNKFAAGANGQFFLGSGLSAGDTLRYELFFGLRAPAVSSSGIFLNPQGVLNVFSFAPAGNPIAPGEFITIYGTGLPPQNAATVPFPLKLGGVQLLINNTPAPLYLITSTQVFAVVPYSVTGSSATIVLDNNGTRSNTITVPLAPSAPGVAAVSQNGLGAGAITHADGSLVTPANPALRGETVVVYVTGLGAVSPPVTDGAAPKVLTSANSVQTIYINGYCANFPACDASNILFQGLSPQYPGLYQINVTIPLGTGPGAAVSFAIQTTNGFTDMIDIAIQ